MRYRSRPKRNLSSAGTNAGSCTYVILLLLLLVLQIAGSDTLGKPNLYGNEHQEQGDPAQEEFESGETRSGKRRSHSWFRLASTS